MYYKNKLVTPSYAVRVRCKKGTARVVQQGWQAETITVVNRLNSSGYMMR